MASVPDRREIRIAIICALPVESQAVEKLFDTIYKTKTLLWQRADGDRNAYTIGRIGQHNVVLTYMPGIGKVNATAAASNINATFPNIELALVVGICGGSTYNPVQKLANHANEAGNEPIYLGDVIISTDIQQSDFGRETVGGFVVKGRHEGNLQFQSANLAGLLHKLRGTEASEDLKRRTMTFTEPLLRLLQIATPGKEEDTLYQAEYFHKHRSSSSCTICPKSETSICEASQKLNCVELQCDGAFRSRSRLRETTLGPRLFLGRVSSSDVVKRDGLTRDHATASQQIVAFEMEAAGVCAVLPTLVVKGVCDYADSHKNKVWQAYAAVTAAACSKALLEDWPSFSTMPDLASLDIQSDILPEDRMQCLASLDFPQLDHRLMNISFPHAHTYEWIHKTTEFRTWLDEDQIAAHNRVLWIKGKPGCGKSTMMKHLHHTISEYLPKHTLLSYFFNARGAELERTSVGMLRALLHQLLSNKQDLLDKLIMWLSKRARGNFNLYPWSFEELENFFQVCAREGHLDNIVVLVDALDECEAGEVGRIANFCENLSFNSTNRKKSCFICISIRYHPNIGMKKSIKLNLDEKAEHREDIKSYVEARLHVEDDQELVDQILQKSNHVFLWAVLVVQGLNSAHDSGADNSDLQEFLSSIPDKLHAIFEQLLGAQQQTSSETRLALQMVLHGFRPFTIRELHFLVKAGTGSKPKQVIASASTDSSTLNKYLISKSRGVLETIRPTGTSVEGRETVQFIHETARDFLLSYSTSGGEAIFDSQTGHEAIARACLKGMLIINQEADAGNTLQNIHLEDVYGEVYMLRWVLHHIAKISNLESTRELLRLYSDVCRIRFKNRLLLAEPRDGDELLCAIIDCFAYGQGIRLHQEQLSNLARLLRIVLGDDIGIRADASQSTRGKHKHALREAIDAAWLQGVEALIYAGADLTARTKGRTILHWSLLCAFHAGVDTPSEIVLHRIIRELKEIEYNFDDSSIQSPLPLAYACRFGQSKFVIALLEAGASLTAIDPVLGTPLEVAVAADRPGIAKILLDYGADPTFREPLKLRSTEFLGWKVDSAWHMNQVFEQYYIGNKKVKSWQPLRRLR